MRPAPLPCLLVGFLVAAAAGCKDDVPPAWPADAALKATEAGTSSVALEWPAASDEQGVTGYRLSMGGSAYAKEVPLAADAHTFAAADLPEAARVRFAVCALDAAGNRSPELVVELQTQDGTPPAWPAGARVTSGPMVEAGAEPDNAGSKVDRLRLSWPAATDRVGVTRYQIRHGEREIEDIGGDQTSCLLHTDDTDGDFTLVAGDAAGNWSTPLPIDVSLMAQQQAADSAARAAERRAAIQKKIAGNGLLKLLGTRGDYERGMVADVFAEGSVEVGSLDDPFADVGGVGVASAGSVRGGDSASIADIGELRPPRERERIEGRVAIGTVDAEGDLKKILQKHLRRKAGRFKACYEKRLKASPGLRGKIELSLTLANGRIEKVAVASDTIGDDGLQACIKRNAKSLRLLGADGEANATLVFAPAK